MRRCRAGLPSAAFGIATRADEAPLVTCTPAALTVSSPSMRALIGSGRDVGDVDAAHEAGERAAGLGAGDKLARRHLLPGLAVDALVGVVVEQAGGRAHIERIDQVGGRG